MIAQQESFVSAVGPLSAASLAIHYPQFKQEEVPERSNAIAAWRGVLCPFPDDATACEVLRRLKANKPFDISAGSIVVDQESAFRLPGHRAEPSLVNMRMAFTVVILEYANGEHHRAFAIHPRISRHMFPYHPHLLDGVSIAFGNQRIPALCVYSGAHYRYTGSVPRIIEFLDQVTTYLARHMIWRRTRRLYEVSAGGIREIYRPSAGEFIIDHEPRLRTDSIANTGSSPLRYWDGYWPGTVAPQTPEEHLRTISPKQECWCCRGIPYGECCRPRDLALLARNPK